MKKLFFIVMILWIGLISCKQQNLMDGGRVDLKLNTDEVNFESAGGEFMVVGQENWSFEFIKTGNTLFSSNYVNINDIPVVFTDEWLTIERDDKKSVKLTAEKNDSQDARQKLISARGRGDGSHSIVVTQKGKAE